MSSRARFEHDHPGVFYLDTTHTDELSDYLKPLGWIAENERIQNVKKAGEGNMNLTVRVRTGTRTFILKQSRPWVEKYPHIEAPFDRALVEAHFYELTGSRPPLAARMPQLLGFDPPARLLCLEDLGEAQDFTSMYHGAPLEDDEFRPLCEYLVALHSAFRDTLSRDLFANREMRGLNHQHIFVLPLEEGNGIDLDRITRGLKDAAHRLQQDTAYRKKVHEAGQLYLADGPCLLHGDYFPGSWLRTSAGVKIIDPEFCFFGPPEFDAGVLLAHLHLSGQPRDIRWPSLDRSLVNRFAGIEIMRRVIGVAQLPLPADLAHKQGLLDLSKDLVNR